MNLKDRKCIYEYCDEVCKCSECKNCSYYRPKYDIEKSKEDARNLNELTDHLTNLIESDDKRFSFEFCVGGTIEIYDKEKEIGYAVHIAPIKYDENGNAINL